jgi:hypothetical protein
MEKKQPKLYFEPSPKNAMPYNQPLCGLKKPFFEPKKPFSESNKPSFRWKKDLFSSFQ